MRTRVMADTLLLAVAWLWPVPSQSQSFNGSISGTARDPSGATVAGAVMVLKNEATGVEFTRISTREGEYAFRNLVPARYELRVSGAGLQPFLRRNIEVCPNGNVRLDVALTLGALAEDSRWWKRLRRGADSFRVVNDDEKAVIVEVFTRYANGEGPDKIARSLNDRKVAAPARARGASWSAKTVRSLLRQPLYRGIYRFGVTRTATGSALKRARPNARREHGQVDRVGGPVVPDKEMPELRIVPEDLAARVDARLLEQEARYKASRGTGRREGPETTGKALLSGGMLLCSFCGGAFELRTGVQRHKKTGAVVRVTLAYSCAMRRRKPGACDSPPIYVDVDDMDRAVLSSIDEVALSPEVVEELLASAPKTADGGRAALAERVAVLRKEKARLVAALATTDDPDVAEAVKGKAVEIRRAEVELAALPEVPVDPAGLRAALEQRRHDWKEALRGSVEVARAAVRRIVGPLTITPGLVEERPDFVRRGVIEDLKKDLAAWTLKYVGELRPALAEGLMTCHDSRSRGPTRGRPRRRSRAIVGAASPSGGRPRRSIPRPC
jgi:hypothetical protein